MNVLTMMNVDIKDKRVILREDLNLPIKEGRITNDKRLRAALPSIKAALAAGARVMVVSHLGRPTEGEFDATFSLAPVAEALSHALGMPVPLVADYLESPPDVAPGTCVLLENVRFLKGEKKNNENLGRALAALCDVFVMDAFGAAHRAQASTYAIARFAPIACAGPLLAAELDALARALQNPARPMVGIIGGSKVSTKLTILDSLSKRVDKLIVGGGIANNFIKAAGYEVGRSLYEPDLVAEAARLMEAARAAGGEIPVPVDVVVGASLTDDAIATVKKVSDVAPEDMILDIGPETSAYYRGILLDAGTVVWNGPVGAFEWNQFGGGTKALCEAVADSAAFSIAGGGDTVAAVEKYGVADRIGYISTGGGAFLEFLEGKTLPAVAVLEERAAQ